MPRSSAPARSAPPLLRLILPALVAALSFAAFLPALGGPFLAWDDDVNLLENTGFRGLGLTQLRYMFTTTLLGHYIPLTWVSFGVNYALGGMDPWGYHLGNLLLHAASAAIVYFIARRLLAAAFAGGVAEAGDGRGDASIAVGAAFAALAWGVHPLRVESVAWITERRDVLCGVFCALAVLAYLRGVAGGGAIETRWWAASVAAFALSLLSKASSMPLPAVLVLLDVYPLRRPARVGWPRLLVEKAPHAALALGAAGLAAAAQWSARAVTGYAEYGVGARIAMTAYGLVFYPWKLLWPVDLSPLYELPPRVDPLAWRFLGSALALVIATAVLVAARRALPGALAAWVYSALLVLPVSGLVVHAGVQLVSDRYAYLSSLGFAVLAGGGLAWLLRARARVRPAVVGAGALAAALVVAGWGAGAWRQSHLWRDSEALWRRAVAVEPDCAVCNLNLGAVLVDRAPGDPGRAAEAEARFRLAIARRPDRALAYHGLGVSLALQRRYGDAEAAFLEYARREPGSAIASIDLGLLRLAQRRPGDAIPHLRRALAISPSAPVAAELERALREHAEELRRGGRPAGVERPAAGPEGPRAGQRPGTTTAR